MKTRWDADNFRISCVACETCCFSQLLIDAPSMAAGLSCWLCSFRAYVTKSRGFTRTIVGCVLLSNFSEESCLRQADLFQTTSVQPVCHTSAIGLLKSSDMIGVLHFVCSVTATESYACVCHRLRWSLTEVGRPHSFARACSVEYEVVGKLLHHTMPYCAHIHNQAYLQHS